MAAATVQSEKMQQLTKHLASGANRAAAPLQQKASGEAIEQARPATTPPAPVAPSWPTGHDVRALMESHLEGVTSCVMRSADPPEAAAHALVSLEKRLEYAFEIRLGRSRMLTIGRDSE